MDFGLLRSVLPQSIRRSVLLATVGLLSFTGCLPYSCQREPNQALFPADSVSRRVVESVPADTLREAGASTGSETHPLEYPRTVRFVGESGIALSDAQRNSIFRFGPDGTLQQEIEDEAFAVPYVIGHRGDTLAVFNAEADRVDFVVGHGRLEDEAISFDRPSREALVYMLATDDELYAKLVGKDVGSHLVRIDSTGAVEARVDLGGPYWRRAGFLRLWGDSLMSLSGYRPVVQTVPRTFTDGAEPDSTMLVGFDSPMLERSHAYATGDATNPPLLTPSAAAADGRLFVLNLRPGWVRIDVYNREGRLQRRLVESHSRGNRNFYPVDLDVRPIDDGYRFAVAVRSPTPRLELFHWQPSSSSGSTTAEK